MKSMVPQVAANSMSHPVEEAARALERQASEDPKANTHKLNLILLVPSSSLPLVGLRETWQTPLGPTWPVNFLL